MPAPTIQQLLADPIAHYPAATVACFDPTKGELPRRELDERTIAYLERLAAAGASALLIAASTGHGHLRTVDELQVWYGLSCAPWPHGPAYEEIVAGLPVEPVNDGPLLSALLRPEDGQDVNEFLAGLLFKLGYEVAFVRPGRNVPAQVTEDDIVANMSPTVKAAAEAGLAVGLYSIPDVSGVPMSPNVAARLVNGPGGDRIVAIKVTEADYETSTLKFLQDERLAHLKIVQGWDPHIARALRDGPKYDERGRQRCGVTSGPMSFAVYQYIHLLAAAERGDWAEVEAAQGAVNLLFAAMQDDPNKFADLQRAKYIMGLGHPLTGTVTPGQTDRVLAALAAVKRPADRDRLARSLNLMEDGPFAAELRAFRLTTDKCPMINQRRS
jgi:dihydrodipicolinate synthase/N-acetylneuraminate lyase